jgi:hypothetical protein
MAFVVTEASVPVVPVVVMRTSSSGNAFSVASAFGKFILPRGQAWSTQKVRTWSSAACISPRDNTAPNAGIICANARAGPPL